MINLKFLILVFFFTTFSCYNETEAINANEAVISDNKDEIITNQIPYDTSFKTIHVFVALCDNKYQGIVKVPKTIGNGQDPDNNLYWGCGYGIRTYFKKSDEWKYIKSYKNDTLILERIVFKHISKNYYLIADAYDGKYIKNCIKDFLKSSSGQIKDTLMINNKAIGIMGNSDLISYIGHNGLMEFQFSESFINTDNKKRDLIILACFSKSYFLTLLKNVNVNPLVWTTGLMAPEAYTLHDAITGYFNNESNESIRSRAAKAYSKYQKCSEKAARNLLITSVD